MTDTASKLLPAVFLDRDGVINFNPPGYVKSWAEFRFLPGALRALRRLAGLPWPLVVVTNQSPVGRGLLSQAGLDQIHARMIERIQRSGGRVDALYLCPHAPEAGCACRKPQPGLLLQAAEEMRLRLPASVLLGDSLSDLQAALAAGVQPLLLQPNQTQPYPAIPAQLLARCWLGRDLSQAAAALVQAHQAGKLPAHVVEFRQS